MPLYASNIATCIAAAMRGCNAPGVAAVTTARRSTAFQSRTSSAYESELAPIAKTSARQIDTVRGTHNARMGHLLPGRGLNEPSLRNQRLQRLRALAAQRHGDTVEPRGRGHYLYGRITFAIQ